MNRFKFSYWLFLLLLFLLYGPLGLYASRLQLTLIVLGFLGFIVYDVFLGKFSNGSVLRWPLRNTSWATIFFLSYMILSSFYGLVRGNSSWAIMGDVFPYCEFIAFSLIIQLLINDEKQVKTISAVLLSALTLKALWTFFLFFTGRLLAMQLSFSEHASMVEVGDVILGRPFDPNITLITPCVLLYFVMYPSEKVSKILMPIFFVFTAFVVLSFTRSIWIGVILSIALMILLVKLYVSSRKALRITGILFLFSLILAAVISTVSLQGESLYNLLTERIFHSVEQLDTKLGRLRIYEIRDALDEFSRNMIFGKGMGGALQTLEREGAKAIDEEKTFIHNYPISMLLKLGSLGMILLLSVLIVMIRRSLLILKNCNGHRDTSFFGISFLIFLSGVLIFVNFQPIVIAYHTFALLGLIFSLMVVQEKFQKGKDLHRGFIDNNC